MRDPRCVIKDYDVIMEMHTHALLEKIKMHEKIFKKKLIPKKSGPSRFDLVV